MGSWIDDIRQGPPVSDENMLWMPVLKQHYVEIDLCVIWRSSIVTKGNTTVVNTDPRSVTICQI